MPVFRHSDYGKSSTAGLLPSQLEKIHAMRVAQLPLPDEHGQFKHTPPPLTTSGAIHDYAEGALPHGTSICTDINDISRLPIIELKIQGFKLFSKKSHSTLWG